jgi:hypothetical protein
MEDNVDLPQDNQASSPGGVGYRIILDGYANRLVGFIFTVEGWYDERLEIIRGVTNLPYSDAPIIR